MVVQEVRNQIEENIAIAAIVSTIEILEMIFLVDNFHGLRSGTLLHCLNRNNLMFLETVYE